MSKLNKEFVRIVFYFISVMFYSAADFRSVVQKEDGIGSDVVILFEPGRCFMTRFYQLAIRPIGLIVYDNEGKEELSTHNSVLTMFKGNQPIVTFNPAFVDINPAQRLQGLILKEPKESASGNMFIPTESFKTITPEVYCKVLHGKVFQ